MMTGKKEALAVTMFDTPMMSLDGAARHNFNRALLKGFMSRLWNRIWRKNITLWSLNAILRCITTGGRRDLGVQQVRLSAIVGSVGRSEEFDRGFFPRGEQTLGRWIGIDKAYLSGRALPPINLYKLGDVYFVEDGNHRVSVAKAHGQQYIDARVVEIDAALHLTPELSDQQLCGCVC